MIAISDLRLETHHLGKFLVLRAFGHPRRIQAVQNAVQDAHGGFDRLALYNEDPNLDPSQLLPMGAIIAIKEPLYKVAADGGYTIRVDHPSDIVFLHATDTRVPSAFALGTSDPSKHVLEWMQLGTVAFSKKDYLNALDLYSRGIAALQAEDTTVRYDLFRNRSVVNLMLKRWEPAQADAEASMVPASEPMAKENNTKAYFLAGRASYELGCYVEAEKNFAEALKLGPDHEDSLKERKRNEARMREEAFGVYDFAEIASLVSKRNRHLDHANFICNTEVRASGSRGRGLFAKKAIKANELVMCERAFSVVFGSEHIKDLYTTVNLHTDRISAGPQASLLSTIVQKLRHNPKQAIQFLSLYDGGHTPKCTAPQVDNATVIDVFQAQAIIERNGFGCPEVRSSNAQTITGAKTHSVFGAVGIWTRASYINHACDGNLRRAFIGDLMIVRASKDIAAGDELFMQYLLPDADNSQTMAKLKNTWGFTCDCAICAAEAQTSPAQARRRKQLIKETAAFMAAHKHTTHRRPSTRVIAEAEQLLRRLQDTYDAPAFTGVPRLALVDLGVWVSRAYGRAPTQQKTIDHAVEVLENLAFAVAVAGDSVVIDSSKGSVEGATVDAAVYAARAYDSLGRARVAEQFILFAEDAYYLLNGEMRGLQGRYVGHLDWN